MKREHPRPSLTIPRRRQQHPCFWCDKMLDSSDVTKDHLVSMPLAKWLRTIAHPGWLERSQEIVDCCLGCNQKRAEISALFGQISIIRKKAKRPIAYPRSIASFRRQRERLADVMAEMERLIVERVRNGLADTLLIEIREVRAFAA